MDTRTHWESVYTTKAPDQVSWYRPHLNTSLALIERAVPEHAAAIIDVGAGQSTLVDDLLGRGYTDVSLLDVSNEALRRTKERLGSAATNVPCLSEDVCTASLPAARYDLWHDRAVFHFLTQLEQRIAYVTQATKALKPGGHVVIATFGPQGPTRCSGLDVVRYDAASLQKAFGDNFDQVESLTEAHITPSGANQQFLYCVLRKKM
jgi:2-polyprenyl-3-methyl-5-hydroxy-6-metoxy-1,4-benzoquinol methylase